MKKIQSIQIWDKGEVKVAEYFKVICINDNYENSATNFWQLYAENTDAEGNESVGEPLANGNLTISGEDYIAWGDQPAMKINEWIYNWSATQLNLVIL